VTIPHSGHDAVRLAPEAETAVGVSRHPLRRLPPRDRFIPFDRSALEGTIPQRFEEQVSAVSQQLAVKDGRVTLTYAQLNAAANRLARSILNRLGEGHEPVAVLLGNGPAAVTAMLGILKAGKAFAVLDSTHPRDELAYLLRDSQARLVVADGTRGPIAAALAREASSQDGTEVLLADDVDSGLSPDNLGLITSPDAVSSLAYTSGSTGRPKGAIRTHRLRLHHVWVVANDLMLGTDDRLMLISSLSLTTSVGVTFSALLSGAALCLFDLTAHGVADLAGWLAQEEITIFKSVPAVFRRFADTLTGEEELPRLRHVRVAGDTVHLGDIELFRTRFPHHCVLRLSLGTTETSVITSCFVDRWTEMSGAVVPVGYAVEGKEVLVLDDDGKALRCHEVGEIAVKSRYLASGYWRQPELTRTKFLPDPDGGDQRIYLTGDLGRLRPDGLLEHLGRKDMQVKIRGFRVELAAVEGALRDLPDIKDAAVVSRRAPSGDKRLVAYVVPQGKAPTVTAVRLALANDLPNHDIPSQFVWLDALPVTRGGKVDRRALPEAGSGRPDLEARYASPRTSVEERLAAMWADVLGVDRIGVHDPFFELGGHSLAAAQLLAQMREAFHADLPLQQLFETPTISGLAEYITAHLSSEGALAPAPTEFASPLVPLRSHGVLPPVFIAIPGGGTDAQLLRYAALVDALRPEQPVYVLVARSHHWERHPRPTVSGIAADYVQAVRRVQAEGPYALCGICIAGRVALEMARELQAHGQPVALLALIDSTLPDAEGPMLRSLLQRGSRFLPVRKLGAHWRILRRIPSRERLSYALRTAGKARARLLPITAEERQAQSLWRTGIRFARTVSRHRPQPYDHSITLLLTADRLQSDPTGGWGHVASGSLKVRRLVGGHGPHLTQHAGETAAQLKDCLHAAFAGESPGEHLTG